MGNEKIVFPGIFENFLVIGFQAGWLAKFGGKLSFRVYVDRQGRLCLVSEQCLKKTD